MKIKIFRVIYDIEQVLDKWKGRKRHVKFVLFCYYLDDSFQGASDAAELNLPQQKKTKKLKKDISSSYRCRMTFYIIHSYITHESCTLEGKKFTASLQYYLSHSG